MSLGFVFRIGPKPGLWAGSSADADDIRRWMNPHLQLPKPPPPRMPIQPRQTIYPAPPLGLGLGKHKPGHPLPRSPAAAAATAAAAAAPSSMEGVAPSSSMRQPPHPWKEFAPSSLWSLLDLDEEGCTEEPLQMKDEEENTLTPLIKQQAMVQLQTS